MEWMQNHASQNAVWQMVGQVAYLRVCYCNVAYSLHGLKKSGNRLAVYETDSPLSAIY